MLLLFVGMAFEVSFEVPEDGVLGEEQRDEEGEELPCLDEHALGGIEFDVTRRVERRSGR